MIYKALLTVLVAVGFGAGAPAAGVPLPLIAEGVKVGGVDVGGLTSVTAQTKVEQKYGQPLRLFYRNQTWAIRPGRLGARASIQDAVVRALRARRGAEIDLAIDVNRAAVRRYVARLNKRFSRPAQNAELVGLSNLAPAFREAKPGVEVDQRKMVRWIMRALRSPWRGVQLELKTLPVKPEVTSADFGSIIVIRRESKSLHLYDGKSPVRTFTVAVGQKQYPTPLGEFEIVVKEKNPTWNPPDSEWAKDAEPIPPGPGNPLGTRWMGISAYAVGIHGTPDAASLGYSASHGCIRLAIPDAEWLFEQVEVGTPVYIVSA